jgi:hypothetical protein
MQPVAVAIATEVTTNKQAIPKDGNQIYIVELN